MVTFDKTGYAANAPFKPNEWQTVAPGLPPGLVVSPRSLPPGFLVVQNCLTAETCDALVAECEALAGARHGVADGPDHAAASIQNLRTSESIDISRLQFNVNGLIREIYTQTIAGHFRVQFEWFERPDILRYKEGGEYKPHADAENWNAETQRWNRVIDRDVSMLLYLNEGFSGGEITFPNFGVKLQPARGLLIAFPSDARYLHAATPVQSGVRYALVSWAAALGTARVAKRPDGVELLTK